MLEISSQILDSKRYAIESKFNLLARVIEEGYTQSQKAISVLANWDRMVPKFVKVMPRDYKRVLQAIQNALASGLSGDDALNAAFEENSRDVARIGGS